MYYIHPSQKTKSKRKMNQSTATQTRNQYALAEIGWTDLQN
jgi:hypothetical protein